KHVLHSFPTRRSSDLDVLQKVQLLVRCSDEKVLPVVILALAVNLAVVADDAVALLLAERWIGKNDLVALAASAKQRVLGLDDRRSEEHTSELQSRREL